MSVLDKKQKIFGNIAAARTITGGMPKLKKSSSFESLNKKVKGGSDKVKETQGKIVTFLTDLIKSLIGFAQLVTEVVDFLTYSLKEIEAEIKKAIKFELKSIVSCGIDPMIPDFVKSTGTGVVIEVNKIDFFDQFMTDPNSIAGKLMYNDVTPTLTNSSDLNTFLYGVIQDDGVTKNWKGIFDFTFNSNGIAGVRPNNTFTIKATSTYSGPPKTLTDLNNDFVDSITLFNTENLINRILDLLFGSISCSIKKTPKQVEKEIRVNEIIDRISNNDSDDEINDNTFIFTNDEVYEHQEQADFKRKGIQKLNCCNKIPASVPIEYLTKLNQELTGATSNIEKKTIISNNLNDMADKTTENSTDPSDKISIKLNFIQGIIDSLIKGIVSVVLSPKVIIIFLIDFKIIYGTLASFDSPEDFIKKNKTLINAITKKVTGIIVKKLMGIAIKEISILVASAAVQRQKEKAINQLFQLLSLVNLPMKAYEIIDKIISNK